MIKQIKSSNFGEAINALFDQLEAFVNLESLSVVGHRIVHGGPKYSETAALSPGMLAYLRTLQPFDPEHLPSEIHLIEAVIKRFPEVPQVACFDTCFHRNMPRVAQMLTIPRKYEALGMRRYGFHGLSYTYLLNEFERLYGPKLAKGKIILAHLGSGASMAAVHKGTCIDTSMGFTPASGLMMSTRSGDIDPGVMTYLSTAEKMNAASLSKMLNHKSGLLGVSESSSDMKDLLEAETDDSRAAEATNLFCYSSKKQIGAYSACLGGLEVLVFAGGIGENSPVVRERICSGLEYLGVSLNSKKNQQNERIISSADSRVMVCVLPTDEEQVIADAATRLLDTGLQLSKD